MTKSVKRFTAILMAALMTLTLLPIVSLAQLIELPKVVDETETIVGWDFESETAVASTANAANTGGHTHAVPAIPHSQCRPRLFQWEPHRLHTRRIAARGRDRCHAGICARRLVCLVSS